MKSSSAGRWRARGRQGAGQQSTELTLNNFPGLTMSGDPCVDELAILVDLEKASPLFVFSGQTISISISISASSFIFLQL